MADVNAQLAASLKQAKTKEMSFAFVAKGAADGTLLLHKTKVPPQEISAAKKDLGGGVVWRGRCQGEDGTLVFQVPREPPATLATQVRKNIQRDAGLTLKVEFRVSPELESEESDGEQESGAPQPPPAPPPPPAANDALAGFKARLAALLPGYRQTVHARPGFKAVLERLFEKIAAAGKGSKFAEGLVLLDQLERALAAANAAPNEGQPTPNGAPATGLLDAGYLQKWQAARQAWQSAGEQVDGQIAALQATLKASNDKDLQSIAEFGLNGVTGNFRVPLMAAFRELDGGDADAFARLAPKMCGLIAKFEKHLDDEAIRACDQNPFGVSVAIRGSLLEPLKALRTVLEKAPKN